MMHKGSESSPLAALTEQIGGESQLNFLIQTFSERVVADTELAVAFKGMDGEVLADHMTNLIKMVFGYSCKSSMTNSSIRGQIILRNYDLFQLGLSRAQLTKLEVCFEIAMADSMVKGEVFDYCKDRFMDLCRMFEAETRGLVRERSTTEMQNDPAMIMMARASSRRRSVAPRAA